MKIKVFSLKILKTNFCFRLSGLLAEAAAASPAEETRVPFASYNFDLHPIPLTEVAYGPQPHFLASPRSKY